MKLGEELEGAPLDEALRWARERARVVLVRLWDSDYFSAGDVNPDPKRFPLWAGESLDVQPRRPRGLAALDNTVSDPPVLWDLRLHAGEGADDAAFRDAVESDHRALPVPPEAADYQFVGVRVFVGASTQDQAWAIAEEIAQRAWQAGGPLERAMPQEPIRARAYEVYPYAPDSSVAFGGGEFRVTPAVQRVAEEAD
jgi:hypothetical protein